MGPLYGTFFRSMARESRGAADIDGEVFESMLQRAEEGVVSLGNAKIGDKTMLDTLAPALVAFRASRRSGLGSAESLSVMMKAAEEGKDSTRDLIARLGRSGPAWERSRGTLDTRGRLLLADPYRDGPVNSRIAGPVTPLVRSFLATLSFFLIYD